MADSDSEHGSDASDTEGAGGFDPKTDIEKLSDKEQKKWDKRLQQWRIFIDFIFRHLSIVTYKFNKLEKEDLTAFMVALEKAESLRASMKLKKSEHPRISNYRMMKEASVMLRQQRYFAEANRIQEFLNIAGRMRGLGTIAGGFFKAMKKSKLKGIDKIKYYMDYWKGFTVRSFDYAELNYKNADSDTFNALEKKYLVWPTVVKTVINLSQKFLKKTSESTGLELLNTDVKLVQKYLAGPEFVVATKIEENLFQKVEQGTKNFLLGLSNPLAATAQEVTSKYELPALGDIDPDLLKPVPDTGVLLELPPDPPKEKKKKKGKKGKKGGKGRSKSASSHKGGKKKKRK